MFFNNLNKKEKKMKKELFHNFQIKYLIFIIIIINVFFMLLYFTYPIQVNKVIKMTLYKQNNKLININDKKDTQHSIITYINTIDFPENNNLTHSLLGSFNISNNFFVDYDVFINVKEKKDYTFFIQSTDGFQLFINNTKICETIDEKSITKHKCSIILDKGIYPFKLTHFQGSGSIALKMYYSLSNVFDLQFIGTNSNNLTFISKD